MSSNLSAEMTTALRPILPVCGIARRLHQIAPVRVKVVVAERYNGAAHELSMRAKPDDRLYPGFRSSLALQPSRPPASPSSVALRRVSASMASDQTRCLPA